MYGWGLEERTLEGGHEITAETRMDLDRISGERELSEPISWTVTKERARLSMFRTWYGARVPEI